MDEQSNGHVDRWARGSTLLVTNVGKLVGAVIGFNELLLRPSARESAVAFAALLFAGAEVMERALIRVLNHLFTVSPKGEG